eukprot:s710_g7.t1
MAAAAAAVAKNQDHRRRTADTHHDSQNPATAHLDPKMRQASKVKDPLGAECEQYREIWQTLEDVFNALFLTELILNIWGSFPVKFWCSGWNVFDFVVVAATQWQWRKVKSLNKIINSIARAVSGVCNAFLIMFIFMCIYAIIGVEWFALWAQDGTYTTYTMYSNSTNEIGAYTGRGLLYGEEYYGTFSRALYTLWQVLTGESWSEMIARPLMFGYETPARFSGIKVGVFFVSFLVVMQVILINVVVAVLLEKMVEEDARPWPSGLCDLRQLPLELRVLQLQDRSPLSLLSKEGLDNINVCDSSNEEVLQEIATLKTSVGQLHRRLDSVDQLQEQLQGLQKSMALLLSAANSANLPPVHSL